MFDCHLLEACSLLRGRKGVDLEEKEGGREGWSYVYGIQNSEMEPNELELALRNGLIRKIIMELSKRLSLRG